MEAIKNLPKPVLAGIVFVLAAAFIMFNEPPQDACDVQAEIFAKAQAGRLLSRGGKLSSLWARTASHCKASKSVGGCADFHEVIKTALGDIKGSPVQCVSRIVSQDWMQKIITESLKLMVVVAWGEVPPEPGPPSLSWLTVGDLSLFCQLQVHAHRFLDDQHWEQFVRQTIAKLPKSTELKFNDAFGRTLFAVRCEEVP
jgi:hypothetical protein